MQAVRAGGVFGFNGKVGGKSGEREVRGGWTYFGSVRTGGQTKNLKKNTPGGVPRGISKKVTDKKWGGGNFVRFKGSKKGSGQNRLEKSGPLNFLQRKGGNKSAGWGRSDKRGGRCSTTEKDRTGDTRSEINDKKGKKGTKGNETAAEDALLLGVPRKYPKEKRFVREFGGQNGNAKVPSNKKRKTRAKARVSQKTRTEISCHSSRFFWGGEVKTKAL